MQPSVMFQFFLLLVALLMQGSYGEMSLGRCPDVKPMPGFKIDKFLGQWYTVQSTSTGAIAPTLYYDIARDASNENKFKMTAVGQHKTLLPFLSHDHHKTGTLTLTPQAGKMTLTHMLDLRTPHTFVVFLTDYDNYAAVFVCKKLPMVHQWSAEIWSRAPNLDAHLSKARAKRDTGVSIELEDLSASSEAI